MVALAFQSGKRESLSTPSLELTVILLAVDTRLAYNDQRKERYDVG